MNGLLIKLENELKLRNYSVKTIKGYLFSVNKFLEFSKSRELNKETLKRYSLKNLKNKNPSTIAKDLFAIKFFFEHVLKQKIKIPIPKKK
jgi:site-specific recombinase XerD